MSSSKLSKRCVRDGLVWLLALCLLVFCCQSPSEGSPGGETHFLTRCDPKAPCGSGLACLCGVCTQACADQAACGSFPSAACVAASEAGCFDSNGGGYCDVRCNLDADCRVVSPAHRCDSGVCRAGTVSVEPPSSASGGSGASGASGASSGSGGSGGSGGSAAVGSGGVDHGGAPSLCSGEAVEANQVLWLGDSFFALTHQITGYLEELARGAGALAPGERYRDNSRQVDNTLALAGNGIAKQYDAGAADGPVKIVIMTGGGADVLLGSCDVLDSACPLLTQAVSGAQELLARMERDGVRDVVYVFYPDPLDAGLRAKVDALRPLIQSVCEASPVPCHWLDLRPTFEGRYDQYLQADGITPNDAGAQASAAALWALMRENCIAQ
ncbi:MAG TPA: SGNH/GDSL hydrolase family protein [Polyangiaceae bacterium]|nr:SGNH/GDSL hydrolase family protein [Polyangiaceae bacterium]